MPGIECVNLLAFIQILVTADFALFFIDENGCLTKLYNKFIKELKKISSDVLKEASITENRALRSHLTPKDRITIARLRDAAN